MLKVSATHVHAERARILEELRASTGRPGDAASAGDQDDDISPHKFFAPAPYPGAIARASILDRVSASTTCQVVMLQGPAGHGKSTTLQQIKTAYHASGWRTSWLTLDDADNDPRRLAIHLEAMADLASAGHIDREPPRRGPGNGGRNRADWFLNRLSRLGDPAAIFLDEFQVLRNRSILTFFRDLFERVPQNVRIFIGSRSLPEVGLAKLLVSNRALVVDADSLRFSPSEVDEFFSGSTELKISGEEIGTIYRKTEGWPAALQLYRLSLVSPDVRNALGDVSRHSPRQLAEYLADNVLALQSPRTQSFLLRTSLLTRLTAPLCDVVTGRTDSQQMLLELERSGLFVRSMDAEGRWFKYHGLFSMILGENFRHRAEAQAREVHHRAAEWHLQQQQYEDAVHHALQCREFTLAAEVFDTWASRLIRNAHLMTVERWFDAIPFEHVIGRPSLAIKVAWALMFLRRQQKLRPLLDHLRRGATGRSGEQADPCPVLAMAEVFDDDLPKAAESAGLVLARQADLTGFSSFELGATQNVVAFSHLAHGDFEAVRRTLVSAHAANERGVATFSGGYTAAIAGIGLLLQGRLPEALDRLRSEESDAAEQIDKSFATAALASCQIWALYEANELDAVEAICGQYHDDIAGSVIPDFIGVAIVSMARLHDVRGRKEKATELLEELERIGHTSGWSRLIRVANWERARRALAGDDVARARMIVSHLPPCSCAVPADWIQLTDDLGGESLGNIRLAISEGDLDSARTQLSAEMARQPARAYRRMKLHLLEALMRQREGASNAAHRSLRKAIGLGMAGGYVRSFLDEGEGMLGLIREAYQCIHDRAQRGEDEPDGHRPFIERLLAASGTDLSRSAPTRLPSLLEPLSDREQQILVFLANGVSNRDMASQLYVSENTVKFHLKNIYAKLAVSSRLQAIRAARQIGLVP